MKMEVEMAVRKGVACLGLARLESWTAGLVGVNIRDVFVA